MDESIFRSRITRLKSMVTAVTLLVCATAAQAASCPALLDRSMPRLQDEKPQNLCQYSGKVVVVVNTAS
jgi:glutathione peroxidase